MANLGRPVLAAAAASLALAAGAQAAELSTMVVLGEDGAAQARVITDAKACPALTVDGRRRPMSQRAAAGTLPVRPTASAPELSKPAAFPVLTCEGQLPRGARRAAVAGRRLPLPGPLVRRIVVIGDTGCRLKAPDAYQACNDPAAYPFARVAARAAAWKPDLVIHVGDYEYRENPCAADKAAACAGSPWGYGWDAWKADFFAPAAPLLAAAPWIAVRGNHEDCARAGQGWMRFIDPRPLTAISDCNDPARDIASDDRPPYAVPLGGGAQVVVLDMTTAGTKPASADAPQHAQFAADYATLDRLSRRGRYTILALHKPILGFTNELGGLKPATPGIQSVFAEQNPAILPKGVGLVLSGHVHIWEQISFSSDHPSQFIAGFSGTQEDTVPMPKVLPAGAAPAPGTTVGSFSSWIAGFGYMTLERQAADRWNAKVWDLDGRVVNRCRIAGRKSRCEKPQAD
ncbi:MAG TPA: metallophosphoesterase [Phenylobacterium sp.]|uniref:metallophosphoesterase family protein n=1 Tax=Phenylobacterium sp. TaxID=1871053 RepID=UPI002B464070|nr:metallophosphoesterase [Phenylobacterium sp.]HKR89432.1 metallophosphoesterase [Phenylobacterium sp.]